MDIGLCYPADMWSRYAGAFPSDCGTVLLHQIFTGAFSHAEVLELLWSCRSVNFWYLKRDQDMCVLEVITHMAILMPKERDVVAWSTSNLYIHTLVRKINKMLQNVLKASNYAYRSKGI
jgi:hypothetical protein